MGREATATLGVVRAGQTPTQRQNSKASMSRCSHYSSLTQMTLTIPSWSNSTIAVEVCGKAEGDRTRVTPLRSSCELQVNYCKLLSGLVDHTSPVWSIARLYPTSASTTCLLVLAVLQFEPFFPSAKHIHEHADAKQLVWSMQNHNVFKIPKMHLLQTIRSHS